MSASECKRLFYKGTCFTLVCLVTSCLLTLTHYSQAQATDNDQEIAESQDRTTQSNQASDQAKHTELDPLDLDNESNDDNNQQKTNLQPDSVFNIDVLIERMKQTDAIGVISKLSLKNQVDDLLEQASDIKGKEPAADTSKQKSQLREEFEGLILKTVTLLNKGEDFTLAEDIYLAREELWKSIMENKA